MQHHVPEEVRPLKPLGNFFLRCVKGQWKVIGCQCSKLIRKEGLRTNSCI